MRQVHDLSLAELRSLAGILQRRLYLDADEHGEPVWTPDKDWSGTDILNDLAERLDQLGMVPTIIMAAEDLDAPS